MTTPRERTALRPVMDEAVAHATEFLEGLPERRVAPTAAVEELREELGGRLPEDPLDPRQVIAELARSATSP